MYDTLVHWTLFYGRGLGSWSGRGVLSYPARCVLPARVERLSPSSYFVLPTSQSNVAQDDER